MCDGDHRCGEAFDFDTCPDRLMHMGDVINLRSVRKAKARATASAQADANRAKFGRTKAEKAAEIIDETRRNRLLDGSRIEDD
jgi:hypothetical protein